MFQESSHGTEEQVAAEGEEEEEEIKPSTSHAFPGNNCEEIDDNEGMMLLYLLENNSSYPKISFHGKYGPMGIAITWTLKISA